MPQQLIYTSAPRGLVAGRSGHCTVARSASMREALMLQLEKLCYYQHLSLSGGQERPIFAYRIVDIRGARFHVLSRIQDAGLDFTGRTNFIAHHLVLTPEELRQSAIPPVILRDWPGWMKSWTKEPQLLEREDWSSLTALVSRTCVPAQAWRRVTGDAVNAYGLLEVRAGSSFRVDDQTDETVLELLAESMEALEVRDTRRDFRAAAWQYTFTTSMQEQDNPADFRWRCIHSDNPAANRFATPDCRALSAVRAAKCTGEETAFARTGRQAPRFVAEPQEVRITEGEIARFQVKAEGVPHPCYQWFSVDRANNGQILTGETNPELVVSNPPLGMSRYVARASNSAGEATTNVATLSVEQRLRLAQARMATGSQEPPRVGSIHVKSEEDIERQRNQIQVDQAQKQFQKGLRRKKVVFAIVAVALMATAGVVVWEKRTSQKSLLSLNKSTNSLGAQPPVTPLAELAPQNQTNAPANPNQLTEDPSKLAELKSKPERPVLPPDKNPLPNGWTSVNVGSVSNTDVDYNGDSNSTPKFDLSAMAVGFATNGDNFLFVYKTNMGGEFRATLQTVYTNTKAPSRQCGIMLRESDKPNSRFLFVGASSQSVVMYCRNDKDVLSATNGEAIPQGKPIFLSLSHQDQNRFVPAYSFDAIKWTSLPTQALSTNSPMLVGFAVCSGSLSNRVRARLLDISPKSEEAKTK